MGSKKNFETLAHDYMNQGKLSDLEELTRRIIFGKIKNEELKELFFTKDIGSGIQYAILNYSPREVLIDILENLKDLSTIRFAKKKLGELTFEEARKLLQKAKDSMILEFAINFGNETALLEFMKSDPNNTLSNLHQDALCNRFEKIGMSSEIADEILMSKGLREYFFDMAIEKASKKVLLKCLVDVDTIENVFDVEDRLIESLKDGIATEEEAKAILFEESIKDESLKLYAIKYASKETLLQYYSSQWDSVLIEACLKELEKLL